LLPTADAQLAIVPRSAGKKSAMAGRHRQHARRARYPEFFFLALWVFGSLLCFAQDVATSALRASNNDEAESETKAEEIVVTATRLPILEDESPASVTVVTSEEIEQRQVRRVADALREVPGVTITQTGAPGQLTSIFTRGLRSEHTQGHE